MKICSVAAVLAALAALAAATPVDAFPRRSCVTCAPIVHHAAVHHVQHVEHVAVREVIVPILAPLPVLIDPRISYHYTGTNAVAIPGLPAAFQLPQQPQAFQAQQPPPQQLAAAANGEPSESDLDRLIDRIEKRVRLRTEGKVDEPAGPPSVPGFTQGAPARSWVNVLQTHCAACHTGKAAKGAFVVFDEPGRIGRGFDASAAWDAISGGRMPPKGRPGLPAADDAILRRDWGIN